MRHRLVMLVVLMLATAFFGEMKVNPFDGPFRFSLGIAAFFFGLLWFRYLPVLATGLCTGVFILAFRVSLDVGIHHADVMDSLPNHLPSAFFYLSFTLLVSLSKARDYVEYPLRMGLIGATIDFASNMMEMMVRGVVTGSTMFNWQSILMLLLFGALRSFFVVGLYNSVSIRQVRAVGEVRQRELERLRMINTGLYEEAFYLKKSMTELEEITRESYTLYRSLLGKAQPFSSAALRIAEHVHEVKKDYQRILAGLSKLVHEEELASQVSVSELCRLAARANDNYAKMLGKRIVFDTTCSVSLFTNQIYALLSVLNNLVANAVEAIPEAGRIKLYVDLEQKDIVFHVKDTGPGISSEDREWVFQPGYTTKYDRQGNPSTGIGLTHSLGIVKSLRGTLTILSGEPETHIIVRIPTDQLLKKEAVS